MRQLLRKVARLEGGIPHATPCPTCGHWPAGARNAPPVTFKMYTGQRGEEPPTGPKSCPACGRALWFTFEIGPTLVGA